MKPKLDLFDRIFGIKCPHCQKRGRLNAGEGEGMRYSYCNYARGEDVEGGGAIPGGPGFYCMNCGRLTWCEPFDEWAATLPAWGKWKLYPDNDRAKYFPTFKYNEPSKRSKEIANAG